MTGETPSSGYGDFSVAAKQSILHSQFAQQQEPMYNRLEPPFKAEGASAVYTDSKRNLSNV